jgi:hypothetical protein
MEEFFQQFINAIYLRLTGTLSLRFILQPVMALIFAVIDGIKDAKAGRPAYLWGLITDPGTRQEQLKSGWKSIGKVAIIAVILDLVYQFIDKDNVNWLGSLIAGVILAIVPYLLLRGPVNYIAGLIIRRSKKKNA